MSAEHGVLHRTAARIYEVPGAAGRFAALEGLRAYAASLIFLVHYCDSYATRVLGIDPNTLRLSTVGDLHTGVVYYLFASHYGVDVFFFLSGFLICRIVLRPSFRYREFLLHRFTRVYPAFAVSLAVWAYIRIVVQRSHPLEPAQLLGNLLFLNAVPALGVSPYNTVTWSLFFEFVFYLSFPLVVYFGDRRRPVTPVKLVLFGVLFMSAALQLGPFFIRFLMFFGGALLAVLPEDTLRRLAQRIPGSLAIIVYFCSTALFAQLLGYEYFIPVFVVTTFVLVLQIIHGDGSLRRLFAWTPLRYLGNISYSFYLVHGLGIEATMNWLGDVFLRFDGPVYVVSTVASSFLISTVLATVLYVVAEKPYFGWKDASARGDAPGRPLTIPAR